ncbi:gp30, partial [Listeria ivanovii FSL F6-596]
MEVVENYREKHELMHNPREYIINSGFIIQIFHEDKLFYSLKINE